MMEVINVEIKAVCSDLGRIRQILSMMQADFKGTDHQVDTYFHTRTGKLKWRKGNVENNLIWYQRQDQAGPRTSRCMIYQIDKSDHLKDILDRTLGVKVVVDKQREIYFVDNIKIHLDRVKGLGTFLEIEAQGREGIMDEEMLHRQCTEIMDAFGVNTEDLMKESYSDLLLR